MKTKRETNPLKDDPHIRCHAKTTRDDHPLHQNLHILAAHPIPSECFSTSYFHVSLESVLKSIFPILCSNYSSPYMSVFQIKTPKPFYKDWLKVLIFLTPKPPLAIGEQTAFHPTKWYLNSSPPPPPIQQEISQQFIFVRSCLLGRNHGTFFFFWFRFQMVCFCEGGFTVQGTMWWFIL